MYRFMYECECVFFIPFYFHHFLPIQLLIETCIAFVLRDVKFIHLVVILNCANLLGTLARTTNSAAAG